MSNIADATPELPDIYTPTQQLLSFIGLGNRGLFSRGEDPLPQALHQLLDYDMDAVNRIGEVRDAASLYALLNAEPATFADHLLLGRLVYASPLGASLAACFAPDGSADDEKLAQRRAELSTYVLHRASWNSKLFEDYLVGRYAEEDRADICQERAELHAAVEAAFAKWQHSLGWLLTAPAPVMLVDGPNWSIHPVQQQLDMLAMTVNVLRALPALSHHPFAQAATQLPDYHPQRLEELGEYLEAAEAGARLPLTRVRGLLLYAAAHLMMMLLVNDVLDAGGLDDLLQQHPDINDGIDNLPDRISRMREAAAIMLSGYIEVVREHESDAADFQALEARLLPVLALASS